MLGDNTYDISIKSSAIRELQRYLLELSYAYEYLPKTVIDGVYDEATRNAVKGFQSANGLIPSGIVDPNTWAMIYSKFRPARVRRLTNK